MSGPTIAGLAHAVRSLTTAPAFEPASPTHVDVRFSERGGRGAPPVADVYLPVGPGPHPSVVLIHGGGWVLGHRRMKPMRYLATELVAAGYAVVVGEYRLVFRGGRLAEALDDVEASIAWWTEQHAAYDLDPEAIHLVGLSAGATLMLLAAQRHRQARFRRLVSVFGVYDFSQMSGGVGGLIKPLVLKGLQPQEVSPLHLPALPWPVTLMHGTDDALVPHAQAVAMKERAEREGLEVELLSYEGLPHAFFNDAASEACQTATRDLLAALRR